MAFWEAVLVSALGLVAGLVGLGVIALAVSTAIIALDRVVRPRLRPEARDQGREVPHA